MTTFHRQMARAMPSAMSRAQETQPAQMVGQGRKSMPGMLLMTKGSEMSPSGTIKSSHGILWESPPTSPMMRQAMKEPYIHKALLLKTSSSKTPMRKPKHNE